MRHIRVTTASKTQKKLKKKKQSNAEKICDLRLYKKITAILSVSEGLMLSETAELFEVSVESVRVWVQDFIQYGVASLSGAKPNGRPAKLTQRQKKELEQMILDGPGAVGYPGQCWRSPMIQDLINTRFQVLYSVSYISELLKNMGFSFQKAKFESGHLNEWKRKRWIWKTWPEILKKAVKMGAYILFGDEASFPQWGTLNYTWAKKGVTPEVKTSGSRRGYKIFGLIEYFTGQVYCQSQEGRLNSAS